MNEPDPLDKLRKSLEPYLKRPITENQQCSFLENGSTREEIADADQAFCKKWESIVFNRDPDSPATLKMVVRLLQMIETDPALLDCDHFNSEVFRYNTGRKILSEHLRNADSQFYDKAYDDFCKKYRFKK